jgi:hypothetical protein
MEGLLEALERRKIPIGKVNPSIRREMLLHVINSALLLGRVHQTQVESTLSLSLTSKDAR